VPPHTQEITLTRATHGIDQNDASLNPPRARGVKTSRPAGIHWLVLGLVLLLILSLACSSVPFLSPPTPTLTPSATLVPSATPTPTSTATQTPTPTRTFTPTPTSTITPTPLPSIEPPGPPAGNTSNVYGRVLWRGEPVPDFSMSLNVISTIGDVTYYGDYVDTDTRGRFVFRNVPAGEFTLGAGTFDRSEQDRLAGIASAIDVTLTVPAGANLNFGEFYLVETDLALSSPRRDSTLGDTPDTLSWQAYPGATTYHVELKQLYGNYTDLEVDTSETQIDLELPLLACTYGWDVTAYSDSGIPLARSDSAYVDSSYMFYQQYDGIFSIENDLLPWCHLRLLSPEDGETISGGSLRLEWELHPLAVRYHVTIDRYRMNITNLAASDIGYFWFEGDFELQSDGRLAGPSLPFFNSGTYYWRVSAYTADGGWIATSGGGIGSGSRFVVP
jgi:hypothetical protein